MGWRDRISRFLGLEKRETPIYVLNENDRELLELLGISIDEVNVRGKNSLKVSTVYACIKILAENLSMLPIKFYQEDEKGIKKATTHYLYNLMRLRPNPYMSTHDFMSVVEVQRNIYGNSFVNIEFDSKGKVVGLWPVDANRVTIYVDDVGLISSKNNLWYVVEAGTERIKLSPEEILHFKSSVTLDGIVGIPPLECLKAVENAASAEKFINNFYKQGLQVKGIVQYVGDLNNEAKQQFLEEFESMSSGLKNSHRIALMPIGYQFVPMSLSMHDAQFLQNTELTIRQIATAFGVKMHQLNDLSRATHTNIEQQQLDFYTSTLLPILTMYEQEMTYKLLLDSEIEKGYYIKFNVDVILRADLKTRYEAYRTGIQGGFLKPNEARAKEDLPPEEGGDQLLVNGNMLPIAKAGSAYLEGGDQDGKGNEQDAGDVGNGEGNDEGNDERDDEGNPDDSGGD